MDITFIIIGIIFTSIGVISITVFSLTSFILKRIHKEERKNMTDEEKRKEKWTKRSLKWTKKLLKIINKKLLENLWAFYGITTVVTVGGVSLATVGAVQHNMANKEQPTSSSEIVSSISSEEQSSYVSSSSIISSIEESSSIESSSIESSSEVISSSEQSSSSEESSSSEYVISSSEATSSSSEEMSSSSEEISSSEEYTSSKKEPEVYMIAFFINNPDYEGVPYEEFPKYAYVIEGDMLPYEDVVEGYSYTHIVWYTVPECSPGSEYNFKQPVYTSFELYGSFPSVNNNNNTTN